MKTRVIPAQITTVEDKIAGNFSLTQIMLLMVPVFWTVIVYTLFPQRLHLTLYKIPLVFIALPISVGLALRIKNKIVLSWLVVLLRYQSRPKYYLFNKNDSYLRTLDLPLFEKKQRKLFKKAESKEEIKAKSPSFTISQLIKLEGMLANPLYSLSLRSNKKGGFNVALEQTQK